jgi:hypothetical protein
MPMERDFRDRYQDQRDDDLLSRRVGGGGMRLQEVVPPQRRFHEPRSTRDDPPPPAQVKVIRDQVSKELAEGERVRAKWRFKAKRPSKTGATLYAQIGEFPQIGDDWKTRIITEIGKNKGPGEYEGTLFTYDGKQIPDEPPWHLEISESEALDHGWSKTAQEEAPVTTAQPMMALTGSTHQVTTQQDVLEEELAAKREKARIELLKNRVEATKIEKELSRIQNDDPRGSKEDAPAMSKDHLDQLLIAERARLEAEHKAKIVEAEARHGTEIARAEADREKAINSLRSDMIEERRKAEDAAKAIKNDSERKDDQHKAALSSMQQSFDAKLNALAEKLTKGDREDAQKSALENIQRAFDDKLNKIAEQVTTKKEQPIRPEEYAAAIAGALSPLLSGLGAVVAPLATAFVAKMTQEPPKGPDPFKQMEALGSIVEKLVPKQVETKQPDQMELMTRTIELVKTAMPQQAPPASPTEVANAVASAIESKFPRRREEPHQDPFQFTAQVMGMAKQFADMTTRPVEHTESHSADPFEAMAETKRKFEDLGIPVQIGHGIFEEKEPPQKNAMQDVFAGIKDVLPVVGEVVGKYVAGKQPEYDPELLRQFQVEQLKKKSQAQGKQTPQRQRQRQRPLPSGQQQFQPQAQAQQSPQGQAQQATPQAQRQLQPQRQPQPGVQRFQQPPVQPATPQTPRTPQPAQQQVAPQPTQQAAQPQSPQPQRPAPQQTPKPAALATASFAQRVAAAAAAAQGKAPPVAPQPQKAPTAQPPTREQAQDPSRFVPLQKALHKDLPNGIPVMDLPQKPNISSKMAKSEPVPVLIPQRHTSPTKQTSQHHQVVHIPTEIVQSEHKNAANEPFIEEVDEEGQPTLRTWGELSKFACVSIERREDPNAAAATLLERFPKAAENVLKFGGQFGIDGLDAALTGLAGNAGPYASVVGDLASKIRFDAGRTWATGLIRALSGASLSDPTAPAAPTA